MKQKTMMTKCTCNISEDTIKEVGHYLDCPEAILDILLNRPHIVMPRMFSFTEVRELLKEVIKKYETP